MEHVIAYPGHVRVSLALMQAEYGQLFIPGANRRVGVDGTFQRAPYTEEDFNTFLKRLQEGRGKDEAFAIVVKEGNDYRYVGHTGIHGIRWPCGLATTGSIIVDTSIQGKGCGTEAKLLLLYHAFMVLGLNNIKSAVKGWNAQSLGHLIKCGYRFVGRYEKIIFHEGKLVDEIALQCRRDDWEPIWEKYQETKKLPSLSGEQRSWVTEQTKT